MEINAITRKEFQSTRLNDMHSEGRPFRGKYNLNDALS